MPRITFNLVECSLTSWRLPSTQQNTQGRGLEQWITKGRLKHSLKGSHIFVHVSWMFVYHVVKKSLFDVLALGTWTKFKTSAKKYTASNLGHATCTHTHTYAHMCPVSKFRKYGEGISEVSSLRRIRTHHKEWGALVHLLLPWFCSYG